MTNELVDQTAISNRFSQVAEETQAKDKLLKFNKGVYKIGDDEIPAGREYIAHVAGLVRGYIKFEDRKPVDRRLGKVADGFVMPNKAELGDGDWTLQYLLPLEDPETGEIVIFATGSHGGVGAIGSLCAIFARNVRNGRPIIKINVSSYQHKTYGRVETPDFPIVGWDADAPAQPHVISNPLGGGDELPPQRPALRDDMDDQIPF
jgi:hypothetical protein